MLGACRALVSADRPDGLESSLWHHNATIFLARMEFWLFNVSMLFSIHDISVVMMSCLRGGAIDCEAMISNQILAPR